MPYYTGVEVTEKQNEVIRALTAAHFHHGRWVTAEQVQTWARDASAAVILPALVDLGLVEWQGVRTPDHVQRTVKDVAYYRLKVEG